MARRITVIGTGYLGAAHAAGMAELGFEVLGVDTDAEKVAALGKGEPPIYEPGLAELLRTHLDAGRLTFTTSYAEAARFGDVHFVCVGTPQRDGGNAADTSYVRAAVRTLGPLLDRPALVVGKSTVPVGTAAVLAAELAARAPDPEVELAWNPEFLREGHAVDDTLRPDRIVLGVRSPRAERILREVYARQVATGTPVLTCDFATAELVKVAANAFLATKISFINAVADVCEATGADVTVLARVLGHDPRIGPGALQAGLGFGGGCLPKDLRAFAARAGELGADGITALLADVDAINQGRRQHAVNLCTRLLGGSVVGRRVGILGAAFKPGTDDVRDSPALEVAGRLHLRGAAVRVFDPKATETARRSWPPLGYADSVEAACEHAELVALLTEWPEFRALDPARLRGVVAAPVVLDARNALDADRWRAAGWTYRALGRP